MTVDKETILKALEAAKTPYTAFVARDLGIPERDLFRALRKEQCTELEAGRLPEIMSELSACKTVFLIVKSGGAVLEVESSISGQSASRGYYNVSGQPAHMHIMPDAIDAAFAVHREPHTRKPMKFSLQFFDFEGKPALKVYLTQDKDMKRYRETDMAAFDRIRKNYRKG